MEQSNTGGGRKTTDTSLRIVDALRERDGGQIGEVADHLGLAKSTVYSHLQTLAEHGYVVREGDTYYLGMKFLEVGEYVRGRKEAYRLARQTVAEVAEKTDGLCQFMVEEHGSGIVICRSNPRDIRTGTGIGKPLPLHQTATGKAILANLPEDRTESIIEENDLEEATENTITDPETLRNQLEEVHERGIAFQEEELLVGINAVGVPVFDPSGRVVGGLGVGAPVKRMTEAEFTEEFPNQLLGAANELELDLRYS